MACFRSMKYKILLILLFCFQQIKNEISCSTNTYLDSHLGKCKRCDPSCSTCRGSGKEDCTSCHPGEFMSAEDKNAEVFFCEKNCSGSAKPTGKSYQFCHLTFRRVPNDRNDEHEILILYIIVGFMFYVFTGLFIVLFLCVLMTSRKTDRMMRSKGYESLPMKVSKNISLSDLGWDKKERIGGGSYGNVYKCFLKSAQEFVAVKELKSNDPDQMNSFYNELAVLSKLRNPYVTSILGYTFSNQLLIITKLRISDLAKYLASKPNDFIQENELNRFCAEISDAMIYLHTKNIIHCDLKASNILVKDEYHIEVSDFGLATFLTVEKQKIGGTWTHMPLEYLTEKAKEPTKFGDVWSFGVTVWQIFTMCRERPYTVEEVKNPPELINFLINGRRLEQPEKMPIEMWAEIVRCFEGDPNQRPSFNRLYSKFARILPVYASLQNLQQNNKQI